MRHATGPSILALLLVYACSPVSVAAPASASLEGRRIDGDGAHLGRGITVALAAIGRAAAVHAVDANARAVDSGGEVRMMRADGVTEWWRSSQGGLEQGVTIAQPLEGEGALRLDVSVRGASVRGVSDDAVAFVDDSGRALGSYSHLVVLDARGARVPARMAPRADGLSIVVDDREAAYPLVVDPLVMIEEIVLSGGGAGYYGYSVAVSADGSRLVTNYASLGGGATLARVYVRSGTTWSVEATLAPGGACTHTADSDERITMSADGSRVLLSGTPQACVFARSGSTWALETVLDSSGLSFGFRGAGAIAADGSRAFVAAASESSSTFGTGLVRVFVRSASTWTLETDLHNPSRATGAMGYWGLAATADGSRVVVLVDSGGSGAGGFRTFARAGTSWSEESYVDFTGQPSRPLGISTSGDGTRAVLALVDTSGVGSAAVWTRTGASWAAEASLTTPPEASSTWPLALAMDASGTIVALGARGALGAPGVAHVFARTGTSWADAATLVSSTSANDDWFGFSVGLSTRPGLRIVVPAAEIQELHVFEEHSANGSACTADDQCGSGFCTDRVCCNLGCHNPDGGADTVDCQACSRAAGALTDGACGLLTSSCRAATGPCDRAEICTGTDPRCPSNLLVNAGTPCGGFVGGCDVADTCDGLSAACVDQRQPAGHVCLSGTGPCNPDDVCDGVSSTCSATYAPATLVCRDATAVCDVAEHCTGTSPTCPPDAFAPAGTVCSATISDLCDAPDVCTGTSADCMATFLAGVTCRASTGGCDAAEACTGGEATCPPDAVSPTGTVCRASTGTCDAQESCDGVSQACPPDISSCVDTGVTVHDAGTDAGARDASMALDAATAPPPATSGCACSAGRHRAPVLGSILVVALVVRRRRPRLKPC